MEPEHLRAVERAVACIEAHRGGRLDLDAIARAAGYSKFHLHRLFGEATGMTVHAYASRRRLTEAARALVETERPVADIARDAGYDSQQTFSAAFAALYKSPPARFRACGAFYPLQLPLKLDAPADGLSGPAAGAADGRAGEAGGWADGTGPWEARAATPADVPAWMDLMRLAVDGFPCLDERRHEAWLREAGARGKALVARGAGPAALAGAAAFDPGRARIDVLAVHPRQRRSGGPARALVAAVQAAVPGRDLAIATYRAGDRADTGYRRDLAALGFEEAELGTELGYPVQWFLLRAEPQDEGGNGRRNIL